MIRTGNCRCGDLQYRVTGVFGPVINCHCSFCRRIHGAPFATLAFVPASVFEWLPASGKSSQFKTPSGNVRHFCGLCSSPVANFATDVDLACVVMDSFAEEFQMGPWFHVNTESKSPWFQITDDLPQYSQWPGPDEFREIAGRHPDALVSARI